MIHEIAQLQETVILYINPLISDHLQVPSDPVKLIFSDIVVVIELSNPIQLHHIQDTLNFITLEEILDLLTILLSKIIAIFLILVSTLELEGCLDNINLQIDLRQAHILDLCLHLEDLSMKYKQSPLEIMTTTMRAFQSQKINLNLSCLAPK